MSAAAKVKAMLENLSGEELEILQLQKRNEGESEYALNSIRKNQQFLVRRLRAVQLLKLGQIAVLQGQQQQQPGAPPPSTYTIVDPKNPTRRLVRFVVPRAPVELVHRNSARRNPTLRGPHWRPAGSAKKKAVQIIQ